MSHINNIKQHFSEAYSLLESFAKDENNFRAIETAALLMSKSLSDGGKIISCGNRGSMCDTMHFAEELSGKFRDERQPFAAISISDPSYLTCVSNLSGNLKNVLEAAKTAKELGMAVVTLIGKDGATLKDHSTVDIRVNYQGYADRIQEIHIKNIHTLIDCIERSQN